MYRQYALGFKRRKQGLGKIKARGELGGVGFYLPLADPDLRMRMRMRMRVGVRVCACK